MSPVACTITSHCPYIVKTITLTTMLFIYKSYKNFDDTDFCKTVLSSPFHVGEIFDDVEDMAWFTSKLLSDIIDEYAPMKRKLVKQESVPYMNAQLHKAMYQRNMARNKFRKYGKQYWQENGRQRNLVVSLRKQSLRKIFPKDALKRIKLFGTPFHLL